MSYLFTFTENINTFVKYGLLSCKSKIFVFSCFHDRGVIDLFSGEYACRTCYQLHWSCIELTVGQLTVGWLPSQTFEHTNQTLILLWII